VYDGVPWGFVKFYVSAKLQVLAYFTVQMQHDFWLVKVGANNVRAGGVVVLSGLGVNMGHSVSILPPNAIGIGTITPGKAVVALGSGKK
jgi:hypothetical protein